MNELLNLKFNSFHLLHRSYKLKDFNSRNMPSYGSKRNCINTVESLHFNGYASHLPFTKFTNIKKVMGRRSLT